jgi:hypothetical protein
MDEARLITEHQLPHWLPRSSFCGRQLVEVAMTVKGWPDNIDFEILEHTKPRTQRNVLEPECIIAGCRGKAGAAGTARGMCSKHYRYWQRHGTPVPVELSLPTSEELAYTAGFIDADGSILIERRVEARQQHGIIFTPRIVASGIYPAPLELFQRLFGGHCYEQKSLTPGTVAANGIVHRRQMFQWGVQGKRAVRVARLLLPFLRIKQFQAVKLIEFQDGALWSNGGTDVVMPITEFNRRAALREEVRTANGKVDDSAEKGFA